MATIRSPVETRAKSKTSSTDDPRGVIPKSVTKKTKPQLSVAFTIPVHDEFNMDQRQTQTLTHSPDLMAEML